MSDSITLTGQTNGTVTLTGGSGGTLIFQGVSQGIKGDKGDQGDPATNLVTSVAGKTGAVSLTKDDVGLSNVDNTSDADKPVSTATQTALDAKATITALDAHTNNTANPHSVTKAQVGLGNVDNTADSAKPISTATQTALDGKVDKNTAIVGATKTKITYDAKGLVTSGTDATTADIADSSNKRYVTDANLTVIGNTSGTNTGDNATNSQYSGLAASKQDTLVSATNIKTINSTSLLGSGDIAISSSTGVLGGPIGTAFRLNTPSGTRGTSAGRMTYLWVGQDITISAVRVSCTTPAAGASAFVVIYALSESGSTASRLVRTEVDASTTGYKTATVPLTSLPTGMYLVGMVAADGSAATQFAGAGLPFGYAPIPERDNNNIGEQDVSPSLSTDPATVSLGGGGSRWAGNGLHLTVTRGA